jgi:hypothetical protein
MAKFEDTPEHKRRQRWDPKKQRFIDGRPLTPKQEALIIKLCNEVGAPIPSAELTVKEAGAFIDSLISRKRKRIYGRKAA